MIILGDIKLIETNFVNEQEIEDLTVSNSEHFFGPSSIFISKAKIRTPDGAGTIPDGFALDLGSRNWFIVEAELGHHSVWTHIAPQVSKQLLASARPETRQLLAEIVVRMVDEDPSVREKFEELGIREIDVRLVLEEIFSKPPIIGMPIDRVTTDLRNWAETLKNDVRLWIVKKYTKFGDQSVVAYDIPEEYRPDLDTAERDNPSESGIATYDVSLLDLIEGGLIKAGDSLSHTYQPRGGVQQEFKGTISPDGSLEVLNQSFPSLSYAALACIQSTGSERTTVNGWVSWKTSEGKTLAQIRSDYLAGNESEAN